MPKKVAYVNFFVYILYFIAEIFGYIKNFFVILRLQSQIRKIMTTTVPTASQMIIDIQDASIIRDLRHLLARIQGVGAIKVTNNYYESQEFYADLDAAEKDIREGKGVRINNAKDLDALFL